MKTPVANRTARAGIAGAATLAIALAAASAADASVLFHAARGRAARAVEQPLVVDAQALAELRGRRTAVLDAFPVGRDGTVTLDVTRVDPFGPDAVVEEMTPGGAERLRLPDQTYFGGRVRGEPDSIAVLVAGADRVRGFVVHGGMTYPFGPDASGAHRSYAMRDVDPQTRPVPGDFCANDLHPELVRPTPRSARAATGATVGPNTVLGVRAAIETDEELLAHFHGSTAAALDYLTSLLAAANVIYERDAKVELLFSYVRLWSTPDPWTAADTAGALAELKSYWTNPANNMDAIAGAHDLVHMISGKTVQGGIAYIGSVCDPSYAFGVSQVNGSFDVSDPYGIWDALVFTHEVGHNLGTPHTHCYQPPLDECYNQEPGCYSGPTSVPPGGGTIMSYCHLLAPGLPNVNLVFGPVVSDTIRSTVTAAACLSPVGTCGNGIVEPGEQCDDGNTVSGDGCSSTCQNEVVCGDGIVEGNEECDDGNTVSGDGCSATCMREPCAVKIPHQAAWSPARLVASGDHFVLHARFGIDASLGAPSVATDGLELLVDGASGAREFTLTLPGGAGWTATPHAFRYRDPGGRAGGVRQIVIRTRGQGVTEVDVKLVSRGGPVPSTGDAPPTLTLVLGGDAAGTAGACGRYGYAGGACGVHGKRLSCH